MTKDELIALRRERGKQELNIGDYVKIYDSKGNIMYDGKIFEVIGKGVPNSNILYKLDGFNYPFFAEDLELMKEPTDEIKVGDRVEVIYQSGNRRGMVCEVKYDGAVDVDFGGGCIGHDILQGRIKKVEPTDKHNTITIPVKADLDDTYWDAYHAELVKELAVKVANNNTINDSMIAYHIIGFATQIVDNLKKQSE